MSVLAEILRRKSLEVAGRRRFRPDAELERSVEHLSQRASLWNALSPPSGPVKIIAEVKRASPSAGIIDEKLDAGRLARTYADAGAAAISVLTDGPGFGGSLADLEVARSCLKIPILRKDFIVDRYQLLEAKEAGADAVLLIVAALERAQLRTLRRQCDELGLDALVEVHSEEELEAALACDARIVGVNNRDLKTFQVDLAVCERLLPRIPVDVPAVAESGIRSRADIDRLKAVGASNFLVGEALVRAPSAPALLRELVG